MPLREFVCSEDGAYVEVYDPHVDPTTVPVPQCPICTEEMGMIWSVPNIDTADTFHPMNNYRGPDGKRWDITNLHQLRKVEKYYEKTGHNVRFDAYSANPNNPDTVDGMGMPYDPQDKNAAVQPSKPTYGFMKS